MTKIFLIRHAEAEGNLYRRAQGHYNSNVTQLGRAQLRALAGRFRDIPLDALYTSDLNRTRSTAAAIWSSHPELTPIPEPRLREIDVGIWEDLPWGNIDRDWHDQLWFFDHDPDRWSVPGGEPYSAVADRMRNIVMELAARHEGGTVAAVSHGLAVRALLCSIFGIPSAKIDTLPFGDNTSVTTLLVENGQLTVESYNDASHLEQAHLSTFARQVWRRGVKKYAVLEPLDPRAGRELYSRCYAATWMASHGDLKGYTPVIYLRSAAEHAARDPRCLMQLHYDGDFAGVVELDPDRGREADAGWISLLYVEPDMRGQRLGVQLIGHAVSYFRRAGRSRLRLSAAKDNTAALGFYAHNGFSVIAEREGVGGPLYIMEADIVQRALTPEEI